jgi:V/A-type H+-transporting ATPase subunit B
MIKEYNLISRIQGDIITVHAGNIRNGELAEVRGRRQSSLAQVIRLQGDQVSLQVFSGTRGISTGDQVRFLGHPMQVPFGQALLGRIFDGSGRPIDDGPELKALPRIEIGGPSVNPIRRVIPRGFIETRVPMVDVFNPLVESQKLPIFAAAGEPYNELLARIGMRARADVVILGGIGLKYDEYLKFKKAFEEAGVLSRTLMFIHTASDPVVERLLVPDLALAAAEQFGVQGQRVLVLLTDMTAFADAMKELGVAQERIPAVRGHMGDLYTQLASRYEKACDFKGAGSVTILSVTTMPGDDVTHPVPDNTGYITEGQFYLHDGFIDPFGSLSRLKQHVVGKATREDHGQIMNTMIRFYSGAVEAQKKQAMAFELSLFDDKLLKYGHLFRERFMDTRVSLPVPEALDLCWLTLAECFEPKELLMKQNLIDTYYPKAASSKAESQDAADQVA